MDFGVTPFDGLPLPTSVTICEVGPRDGLQNESTVLPAGIKAEFVERLVDAGNTVVETTSFVHPKWVPQLADAEEVLRKVAPVPGVRYPVLVPNQRGLDRAIDLGVSDIAVFGSVTETSARLNLNRTVDESLEMFAPAEDGRHKRLAGQAAWSPQPVQNRHRARGLTRSEEKD